MILANRQHGSSCSKSIPTKWWDERPTDYYVDPERARAASGARAGRGARRELRGHAPHGQGPRFPGACFRLGDCCSTASRPSSSLRSTSAPRRPWKSSCASSRRATRSPTASIAAHFLEIAAKELERADRYGNIVSIAMIDADHFKDINDSYGHAAGDRVLRTIADRCRSVLRKTDVFGRFGGEEFVVLFVETGLVEAQRVAERLSTKVAEPMSSGMA